MRRTATRFYRWWRSLNRQGLVEGDFRGLGKHERAKALGVLVASAPTVPLMISDLSGLERGWLWYAWSAIAVAWFVGIVAVILYQTAKTFLRYCRDWNDGRK